MTTTSTTGPVTVLGAVRAMACDVVVHGRTSPDDTTTDRVVERALEVVRAVHDTCTRFDPASPLMRVNARPAEWHPVPQVLFDAVGAAWDAYRRTGGRFDPRVLGELVALGYDRSLPFTGVEGAATPARSTAPRAVRGPWRPGFRAGPHPELHLGGVAVDLGGIGKGLAVRWASHILRRGLDDFLLDAGGDCHCQGSGPDADGWLVGVEDPNGGDLPVAVLSLRDQACATSSTRLRRWRAGSESVHHLIDPSTGRPGGVGLASVTVVATDAADAEVSTKALFLGGIAHIADEARRGTVAALWVEEDGTVAWTAAMAPFITWRGPRS